MLNQSQNKSSCKLIIKTLVYNGPISHDISKFEFRNIAWKTCSKTIYQQLAKKQRPEPWFCAQESENVVRSFLLARIAISVILQIYLDCSKTGRFLNSWQLGPFI
jgi:hypothetical protein